jgi:hypothetical protein
MGNKPVKYRKVIVVTCLLGFVAVALGGMALQFNVTRKALVQIASTYPISAIVNRLQRYTIPSNNQQCLSELAKRDVDFKAQSSFSNDNGCSVQHAVRLSRVGNVKLDNAPLLTCSMATQLAEFESDYLQPTAQSILGSKVNRIKHLGTYNCRSMRQFKGVLSQHAFANAIDVSAFVTEDGKTINVERDWKGNKDKSKFLKQIASSACLTFRVSVSPDGDANHFNHLHWDTGLYRSCR